MQEQRNLKLKGKSIVWKRKLKKERLGKWKEKRKGEKELLFKIVLQGLNKKIKIQEMTKELKI